MKSARFSRWHTIFLICALALVLAAAESECEAAGDPSLELTTPTEIAEVGKDAQLEESPSPTTPYAVTDKPGVVQNLKIESTTHDSITLRWGAPANATEVSVERYEITVDIAFFTDEHHFVADTTFTDDGLERRKTRRYRVRAVSEDGVEGAELTISGTTQSGPSVASLLTKTPPTPGARPGPSPQDTPTPAEAESEITAKTELVPTTHTVQPGEWLAAIAFDYQVDLQDLMDANGLDATSVIHPGQVLVILGESPATTTSGTSLTATPTPTGTASSTPVPACLDPAVQRYLEDIGPHMATLGNTYTELASVFGDLGSNPELLFEETWIFQLALQLVQLELSAESLVNLADAPPYLANLETEINAIASDSIEVSGHVQQGIDFFDVASMESGVAKMLEVNVHLANANAILGEVRACRAGTPSGAN